jgi:hypothetical protein
VPPSKTHLSLQQAGLADAVREAKLVSSDRRHHHLCHANRAQGMTSDVQFMAPGLWTNRRQVRTLACTGMRT